MNSWVLVLTSWIITSSGPADVAIDPIRYFRGEKACQTALLRATAQPPAPGQGQKYQCVFNGI